MRPGAGRSVAVIAPDPVPAVSRRRELGLSSARSLLLTVLGEYVLPAGEPVWTRTPLAALGLLGGAEKAPSHALARTSAERGVTSSTPPRPARWRPTDARPRH